MQCEKSNYAPEGKNYELEDVYRDNSENIIYVSYF